MKLIDVYCENNQLHKEYTPGTTLLEVAEDMQVQLGSKILAALVNNELKSLDLNVYTPIRVNFIDLSHRDGMRTYQRSLTFVLQKAIHDVLPEHNLRVEHSVSKGLYCEITNGTDIISIEKIKLVKERMAELINLDLPFEKKRIPTEEAIDLFEKRGYKEKALLLKNRPRYFTSIYYLDGDADYYYGPLLPSTGYLKVFGLFAYYRGALLMFPKSSNPDQLEDITVQDKMFDIFQEHKDWNQIMGSQSVGHVNALIQQGQASNFIKVNEALQEKKYGQIADIIHSRRDKVKLVLISGPSSSGKTTTAKRISVQLQVSGIRPIVISLDNYFVNRVNTPRDETGEYDFEVLEALDLELFNQQMTELLDGKTVVIPKYSFDKGERYYDGTTLTLGEQDVMIVEGIHALNPGLTRDIKDDRKFKIYASALTSLALDNNNRLPTTDNRLIRRIVRDAKTRSYSALDTLRRWPSVRRGEDKNIFPYQENADIMFNSSLLYELSVLRKHVEPLLWKVPPTEPEYAEAIRLMKFLSYFENIDLLEELQIPPTSVIREFIGFSSFDYS